MERMKLESCMGTTCRPSSSPASSHTVSRGFEKLVTSFSNPRVTVWLDAGDEEGLHVVPMHDSNFIRSIFPRPPCAGVILPDSIHGQASDLFVGSIRDYVATGGHLMLVYDAAVETLQGFYSTDHSRLSDLAGVDYALYKTLGSSTIQASDVSGSIPMMDE